jgi:TolA-binding protein
MKPMTNDEITNSEGSAKTETRMKRRGRRICKAGFRIASFVIACFLIRHFGFAQPARPTPGQASSAKEIGLVKQVIAARREYQNSLEQLHAYYDSTADAERRKWAETELVNYHRVPQPAYIIDLDVAGPGLKPDQNVPAANELYRKAIAYKGKGFASEYQDNLIRCELLLQQLLAQYPSSNKCSDSAYYLGEIYENRKPPQYRRSATYFERCVQWNPNTQLDARLRAARLYDRQLSDKARAVELYKDVLAHETDERRRQEAERRLGDLKAATP